MSSYDQAMLVLAGCGIVTLVVVLWMAHEVDRLERERKEREAAQHPAE